MSRLENARSDLTDENHENIASHFVARRDLRIFVQRATRAGGGKLVLREQLEEAVES